MRRIVGLMLCVMLAAFVTLLYVQREGDAAVPLPVVVAPAVARPSTPAPPAEAPAPLRRPVRVVALGWELLAPGVLATEKPADGAYTGASSIEDVEAALARGGGDAGGADLAIVPLAQYVASYERLRALAPEIVFVVGWSRGREAVYGPDASALSKLPAAGPVKVAGVAAQPETFLALFLLELAGVPASRVELADKAALTTQLRSSKQRPPGKLLVTSADTPHLMPIVAIAPRGFVDAHAADLEAWGRGWLAGVTRLQQDVPAASRQVAALPGAPAVLGLIEALGQVEFASLRENAVAFGLSGRGALTLDELFRTTWRIWRDTSVLTTPPPEVTPLYPGLVAQLVRASAGAVIDPPRGRALGEPTGAKRPGVLLVVSAATTKLDPEVLVSRIGFVAAVFDRLPLRISVKGDVKTAELLAGMARERFGLRPTQLTTSARPAAGTMATIEVMSAP